jgi:hypothetical protein
MDTEAIVRSQDRAGETIPGRIAGQAASSIDPQEVARFSAISDTWWDASGARRPTTQRDERT